MTTNDPNSASNSRLPALPEPSDRPIDSLAVFEILLRESADSLLAFLRAATRDDAAADDLFQETMVVAWRRLADYDRTRAFGAWLRGIAKRLLLAHRRELARAAAHGPASLPERLDHLDQRIGAIDARDGSSFLERIAAIDQCVERLATPQRDVIRWFYSERRGTDEIARLASSTKDAIQKRLQRARSAIADCLARRGFFAPQRGSP